MQCSVFERVLVKWLLHKKHWVFLSLAFYRYIRCIFLSEAFVGMKIPIIVFIQTPGII